jgi:iron complex outermembrane receptor protein
MEGWMMKIIVPATVLALAVLELGCPCTAAAQPGDAGATGSMPVAEPPPAPPPASADAGGLETVVVTARRSAENAQDVPVAISTMSADDLRREQIVTPQDLQGRMPSLVIGSNSQMRNTETPTIRGQGAQYGAAPGVIIYYGEVAVPSDPVANNQGGPGKFFDLANIQVLKGSQGTLFGRNTTGGALLLEPHRPEGAFSASLKAQGSTYSGQSYEGVLNTPLVGDSLLLRLGGQYYARNGYTYDVATGKDYDSKRYWTARLGLTWRPADELENYLLVYYTGSRDNGTGTVIEAINREGLNQAIPAAVGLDVLSRIPGLDLTQTANLGCLVLDTFGHSSNCGQDILDEQHARGPRRVQQSADPDDHLRTGAAIDHFSWMLSDNLTLRNIASFSTFKHHYRWDLDGSRAAFNEFNSPDNIDSADLRTWTEELQLQGTARDNLLKFVAGGYYEHTSASGGLTDAALFIEQVSQGYQQSRQSYAPFAQASYNLGDLFDPLAGLSLTAGARYTFDKIHGSASLVQNALGLATLVNNFHTADIADSAVTWTVGLDYKLGASLLYGKLSRGYKTGGMSVVVVNPAHYTYAPEYVTNYELGQKSDFTLGGMPVRINTALYYTNYTNLQKAGTDSYVDPNSPSPLPQLGEAIFNVGKAWVAGAEVEGMIQPLRGLTLSANYGYTRAQYTQFTLLYGGATPQLDCTGQQVYRNQTLQLACVPFQATPHNQFSVSTRYQLPLERRWGNVEGAVTYAWTDKQYSAQTTLPQDEPGSWLPAYGLLNASLNWSGIFGSGFDAQVFGSNLTNKLYRISNSNQWHLTYFQSSIWSEPVIVGLSLGYHWD